MALQSSGQISLNNIGNELGISPPFSLRSMSSTVGFSSPDSISEFYGYTSGGGITEPAYSFVVTNNVSRLGRYFGDYPRQEIDGNGYDLYLKPSSANTNISNYTLVGSYIGDPVLNYSKPIYGEKGNIIGYDSRQLSYSNRKCMTDVSVSYGPNGELIYTVSPNTRGDQFYIDIVYSYLYQ